MRADDFPRFLEVARAEGWSCDTTELAAFMASYPEGCLAAEERGEPVGFAMAYRHQRSAWIGNLIVAPGSRGHGVGGRLLDTLIERLDAIVERIYLNAAPAALELYRRHGFTESCRVARMSLAAIPGAVIPERGEEMRAELVRVDAECWGDWRGEMLMRMLRRRWVLHDPAGAAYLGLGVVEDHVAIGPFVLGLPEPEPAVRLLRRALEASWALAGEGAVLMDAPDGCTASTTAARELGGVKISETLCMIRGEPVVVDFSRIASFASLGSKG